MRWIILLVGIVLNAVANILMKLGMLGADKQQGIFEMLKSRWMSLPIISGIICFALGLAAYSYVLSSMNLSVAYPVMSSSGFVIIGIVSWFFFHEAIVLKQVIGMIAIIIGIWLVAS